MTSRVFSVLDGLVFSPTTSVTSHASTGAPSSPFATTAGSNPASTLTSITPTTQSYASCSRWTSCSLTTSASDAVDTTESGDSYEVMIERHRAGTIMVTSNRGPATFTDVVRAQSAIDHFTPTPTTRSSTASPPASGSAETGTTPDTES